MGVDTKVLLKGNVTPLELMLWAEENYNCVSLTPTNIYGFCHLNFKDGDDQRNLSVFYNDSCKSDYEDFYTGPATLIVMGCWGNSEVIARKLVAEYGGWFMVNDCEDSWTRLDQ